MSGKDVFICHATEDKSTVADPLVAALEKANISYWYDKAEIKWGDSIIQKVNEGLRISRFVIVILSSTFIRKNFAKNELNSVLNLEIYSEEIKVLPLLAASNKEEKENILKSFPLLNSKLYETWDGNADKIIQPLLIRLAEKKTRKSEFSRNEDNLSDEIKLFSDKEVDYTQLRNLLAAGKWQKADRETATIILKLTGKEKAGWVRVEDLEKLPCTDLRTIDALWLKYSQGRFGISVQKRIWLSLDAMPNTSTEYALGTRLGWRVQDQWLGYSQLTFSLDAPEGHLPAWGRWAFNFGVVEVAGSFWGVGMWTVGLYRVMSTFLSRVGTCT